jgi:hypothetical protein
MYPALLDSRKDIVLSNIGFVLEYIYNLISLIFIEGRRRGPVLLGLSVTRPIFSFEPNLESAFIAAS